jgi:Domain of unknown function (DUF6471)
VSEADTSWANLATHVIRVALARGDISYAELANALTDEGYKDNERSIVNRVSRGTVRLTLLLQIIQVTGDDPPALWAEALRMSGTWESCAQAVLAAELSRQPWVTPQQLVNRLALVGISITEKTLTSHLSEGTVSLSLFLQCVAVLGSPSLDRFVPFKALISAAKLSVGAAVG